MLQKNTVETSALELLIKLQAGKTLNAFHLAGGTSLALQIGHRKSVDLDLFSQTDFDTNFLLEYLEQNFKFKVDYTAQNTLKGSINNIKLDLISHKYTLVKPIINTENIRLYSIEDIAAMKLNAIAGNGTRSKDFIDIYFILKKYTLEDVLSFYKTKYKERNLLHVVKSLNYFDDINIQDRPEMISEQNLSLQTVKEHLKKQVFDFSENL